MDIGCLQLTIINKEDIVVKVVANIVLMDLVNNKEVFLFDFAFIINLGTLKGKIFHAELKKPF
jgi:hypothetical protein